MAEVNVFYIKGDNNSFNKLYWD